MSSKISESSWDGHDSDVHHSGNPASDNRKTSLSDFNISAENFIWVDLLLWQRMQVVAGRLRGQAMERANIDLDLRAQGSQVKPALCFYATGQRFNCGLGGPTHPAFC